MEAAEKLYNAKESMMIAQNKNTVIGSSTCIMALLSDNVLDVANVGDSKLKIIRDGHIIFSTKAPPSASPVFSLIPVIRHRSTDSTVRIS